MNCTIKTLEIKVDDKTIPLTKAIFNQLEWLDSYSVSGSVLALGTVSTPDGIYTVFETLHGLRRSTGDMLNKTSGSNKWGILPRIILLK